MNKYLDLEKIISNLVNEFNSQNYEYVIKQANNLHKDQCFCHIFKLNT